MNQEWAPQGWDREQDGDFVWNDGFWTEGLDRCATIRLMMETLLEGHPAIKRAGAQALIAQALANLDDAYQLVGQEAFKPADTPL
ncbi:hypothetical protein DFO67_12431 [Modicisalibacter xianhensis]|uniref:Uncharacterized protein n=1 Tax=Modicisalibacter xianhensis TaxID=442341 RepID=A0A4R8FD36_9GAMM|nr:hypothetical protein [Halomonas xianhensis]TDX23714.1 hypothetical protein DFO67_12431 [Halomonas xianhensis]